MFQVKKLGMPNSFIIMIRFLFQDAFVSININNQVTKAFARHGGACQEYPLALYLFITVAEL